MKRFPSARPAHGAGRYPYDLTRRQLEVLRLVAAGQSDREIAGALCISHYTVSNHVAAILAKLGVTNRAAAAARAVRIGVG